MKVSSEEILTSLAQTDKLVCGEGLIWEVECPSYEGFDYLYQLAKVKSEQFSEFDYDNWLNNYLAQIDEDLELETLQKQKQLYYSIIVNSAFRSKLCTEHYPDFINRFAKGCMRGPLRILLSAYDFIPIQYASVDNVLRTYQILGWRMEVLRRYQTIRKLESRLLYGNELFRTQKQKDDFGWNIYKKQYVNLIKDLRRYFEKGTDLNHVANVLQFRSPGNIIWIGKTEALAYLFHLLYTNKCIWNMYWASIISKNMMFVSKKGTLITNQNLNKSLSRIRDKKRLNASRQLADIYRIVNNLNLPITL